MRKLIIPTAAAIALAAAAYALPADAWGFTLTCSNGTIIINNPEAETLSYTATGGLSGTIPANSSAGLASYNDVSVTVSASWPSDAGPVTQTFTGPCNPNGGSSTTTTEATSSTTTTTLDPTTPTVTTTFSSQPASTSSSDVLTLTTSPPLSTVVTRQPVTSTSQPLPGTSSITVQVLPQTR